MILQLVKKDILIAKKYVLIMMALIIAIPLYVGTRMNGAFGFAAFLYMVLLGEMILCQSISMEETKYPKAAALLCTASYTRSAFVIAKYIFFLLVFAYCYIVYVFISMMTESIIALDLYTVLAILLLNTVLYGVYIPFQFKFGFAKTRFFTSIIVFALSFGPPLISNYITQHSVNLSMLQSIPYGAQCMAFAGAVIVTLWISISISLKIYNHKEL